MMSSLITFLILSVLFLSGLFLLFSLIRSGSGGYGWLVLSGMAYIFFFPFHAVFWAVQQIEIGELFGGDWFDGDWFDDFGGFD